MNNNYSYPAWLDQAIGYQIYPQSFQDSNGDGIGDLNGIRQRLDYLKKLGINLIWLSPIFDSPFLDAGYDVRDFKKIAPRYGTLVDFNALVAECHAAGIRLMLDLVPGHTSIDHPWFVESCRHQPNRYTNRYVWTKSMYSIPKGKLAGMGGFLQGYGEREGAVACNFFWSQPKLNYGVLEPDPAYPWELPFDHPDIKALWEDMFDIIRYWLDLGVDGFRIDSAKSICPDRPPIGKGAIYQAMRKMFDQDYPHAALLSEWGWPSDALACGIHVDFLLHNNKAFNVLFSMPGWENGVEKPIFSEAGGDVAEFLEHFLPHYQKLNGGMMSLMTGNHDYMRAATGRSDEMVKAIFAFLLTMPVMPMIYYGDEIAMPFLHGLASVEGGYRRTGARTPMQWDEACGFSEAAPENWYLPCHYTIGDRAVSCQEQDPSSVLNTVRRLNNLRVSCPALNTSAAWEPLVTTGPCFLYKRQSDTETLIIAVNPPANAHTLTIPSSVRGTTLVPLLTSEQSPVIDQDQINMPAHSFAIYKQE
jgi:alpha-glucosidase